MNKRLLIAVLFVGLTSCRLANETMTYEYHNLSFDAVSDSLVDPEFDRILKPYKDSLSQFMSKVVAQSAMPLVSQRPESPLSNLISDLTLAYAIRYCQNAYPDIQPRFSLINHGSLRTSLPKGDITMGHLYELMPFENELVLLQLTGKQVIELANYIASRDGEGVAGLSFGIRQGRAENITLQGMRIDENLKYWMVTSDYIAKGGDGMKVLTWAEQRIVTQIKIRDMIVEVFSDYKKNHQLISAKSDRRLYHVE